MSVDLTIKSGIVATNSVMSCRCLQVFKQEFLQALVQIYGDKAKMYRWHREDDDYIILPYRLL